MRAVRIPTLDDAFIANDGVSIKPYYEGFYILITGAAPLVDSAVITVAFTYEFIP